MYPTRLYLFWSTIPSLKIPSYCGCNIAKFDWYNCTRQNRLNANLTFTILQNAQNAQNTFSTFCWCNANHRSWRDVWHLYHVRSQGFVETNISRCPFQRRMYRCYHSNTGLQRSVTVIYPSKQSHNIRQTWVKSQDGWQPMQPAAMRRRIHPV